jgi:hypothetical protein
LFKLQKPCHRHGNEAFQGDGTKKIRQLRIVKEINSFGIRQKAVMSATEPNYAGALPKTRRLVASGKTM